MRFECKKTENCFADSQTYEYRLPTDGESFASRLSDWETRRNMKLRRPVFVADRAGVNIKGVLASDTIKVSFPAQSSETDKAAFEAWLGGINE